MIISYIGVAGHAGDTGSRMLFEGFGVQLTKGGSVSGLPAPFNAIGVANIFGIPTNLIIFAVMVVISYYLFERSKWGREVYMIGCNETATRFSGIKTKKVLLLVYIYRECSTEWREH